MILSGCHKDSSSQNDLIGTWTMQSGTFSAMVGTKTMTQYFIDNLGLTATQAQALNDAFNQSLQQTFTGNVQLKSDNTYTSTLGGEADSGTWSLSTDGKKLTIDSINDVPVIMDVVELTSTSLHLNETETTMEDLNSDSIPETITVTVDLIFNK